MDLIGVEILNIFPKVIQLTFFPRITTLKIRNTKYFIVEYF